MTTFIFNPVNTDDECISEFNKMETYIDELKPDYTIGNDGIGSYEFQGQQCHDSGTNYIDELTYDLIFIKVSGLESSEKRKDYAQSIVSELPTVTVVHTDKADEELFQDYKVVMVNESDNGKVFSAAIELKPYD